MVLRRRVVLSGFALPAVAGLGLAGLSEQRLPGPGGHRVPEQAPAPGLPTFTTATHDTVLTEATAAALAGNGLRFSPAPGSTEVPAAAQPSTRLALSVGSAALDLLTGVVHFDGGFTLASGAEQAGDPRLTFGSFSSQLADGVATAWLWRDGQPGDRIEALTYDLSTSSIEIDGSTLTLGSYQLFLTDQAVAAIQEVFPDAPVGTSEQFADGSATGTFIPSPPVITPG